MRQELELDLDDKSSMGLSPITVLPSHQYHVNVKRSKKGKPTGKDDFFTVKEGFSEIKFSRFRSASCKSSLSRHHGLEGNIETRRSSMCQSSEEVKSIKKMSTMVEGRKKIEISTKSDTSFTGSIVESLCGSDEEGYELRSSEISQNSNLRSPYVSRSRTCKVPDSPNNFIEICINSDVNNKKSTTVQGGDSTNLKCRSNKAADSVINDNCRLEKDMVHSLQKSLSANAESSQLPSPLGSDFSSRTSPKVQFTPSRRSLNLFTKSISWKSPVSQILENEIKSKETANIARHRTHQKSMLNDLSNIEKHSDIISEFISRDIQYSGVASSPIHLHGDLKLANKHGVPSFEFKVKCPGDVFVAKTWRTGKAFNWVYTFHSIDNRKKSNATGLGSHDVDKDSSIVAQMLVSCNLCSELQGRVFDNSMVTEFVLYDFTHSRSRHSVSGEKKSSYELDGCKTSKASHVGWKEETMRADENCAIKNKLQDKSLPSNVEYYSNSYPFMSSECYPNLEIAAIVLQIPFSKKESLKYKRGDRISAKEYSSVSNHSVVKDSKSLNYSQIQEQVKVVIPTGNHGLPNAESQGPSSLLDRLRHGGGCDCGGWDMACPLILLGNPTIHFAEDHPLIEERQPLELFVQGSKGSSPTFNMTRIEEGHYAVDFHAQLSTLQAFSICVAILHGSSAFSSASHEKNQQLSKCSSLKMLLEKDLDLFFKSISTEKKTGCNNQKGIPPSYVLNPPFSPIARV